MPGLSPVQTWDSGTRIQLSVHPRVCLLHAVVKAFHNRGQPRGCQAGMNIAIRLSHELTAFVLLSDTFQQGFLRCEIVLVFCLFVVG